MAHLTCITTGEEITVPGDTTYSPAARSWVAGSQRFSDATGGDYIFTPDEPSLVYPKVGPIHFQMLFTPAETVTADELKATDKVLAAFWKLVDDPRTDTIDLGLQSVQNAIEYTLTAIKNAGVDVDVPARKAAILSGVLS